MSYKLIVLLVICFWGILLTPACSSQTPERNLPYPSCEQRATTDPGRLNIRANAEDHGMISPCTGTFEIFINPNSRTRSLLLDLEYRNMDDEVVHQEQIRADLEPLSTGMLQKEITASPVEGEFCRTLQIAIRSMTCFSDDGSKVECPQIRIIPPKAFESFKVSDETLKVCYESN